MEAFDPRIIAGQALGLVALVLCLVAFASKKDDRLFAILISANVAFALHFVFFNSWVAVGVTSLIVLRIILVRRYKGNMAIMMFILMASLTVALLTWQRPIDIFPVTAAILGTVGMFMLRGIPMRLFLAGAALAWTINNLLIGSIGGTLAEALILVTNLITIGRMAHDKKLCQGKH